MSNELGVFLRSQRGKMSLREFAAKCHISHTHLDSLEKGYDPRTNKPVSISTETLRLIADGLDIDFVFLACLADGWDPNAAVNAKIPAGYHPKEPFKKPSVRDEDIKFALFGGEGEITDAMYDEVKRFAQMVKLREEVEKKKE
ncbi:MAG: helix-turn-helix transcriptional regulator [Oscillospiraceae bacterium]|nr:helix-turn-helix transcriptional regulator [Oscillospiraceae bacterium]